MAAEDFAGRQVLVALDPLARRHLPPAFGDALADALEQLGDIEGARASYREVERRFSDSATALIAAERLSKLP